MLGKQWINRQIPSSVLNSSYDLYSQMTFVQEALTGQVL